MKILESAGAWALHYFRCVDSNCTRIACADKRGFKIKISKLEVENNELRETIESMRKNDSRYQYRSLSPDRSRGPA